MPEAYGVTVRRRAHRAPDPDRAAGARHILDQDGFAERCLHSFGQNPGHRIGRTAGGKRHHNDDGMRREIVRKRIAAKRH
jgi:hypothetical protein